MSIIRTPSKLLAMRVKTASDATNLTYQRVMEQYEWGDIQDEARLRALIAVEVDTSSKELLASFEISESSHIPDDSILAGNTRLAEALRYNLKRVGAWHLAVESKELSGLLRGRTSFRAISTTAAPEVNQWAVALAVVFYAAAKLKGEDLAAPAARKPKALAFVSTRAQAVVLYEKVLNLCYGTGIMPRVLYGTWSEYDECLSYGQQLGNILNKKCDILIGPPGRFLHVLEDHYRLDGSAMICLDQVEHFLRGKDMDDEGRDDENIQEFFAKMGKLRLVHPPTTIFIQGSTISDAMAEEIWEDLGVPSKASKVRWNFQSAKEPDQVVKAVDQKFTAVDDGSQVLEEAGKVIRQLIRQNRGVLVIVPTLVGAAWFKRDLVTWLKRDGMSEPEERVGLFSSSCAQGDNERMLKRYMYGNKVKVLVSTHMLAEIPDFHVTRAIVWIGLPRQGIDYRNGLMRVYRSGKGKSGKSHAFIMDADGWDLKSIAAVIAEKGEQMHGKALKTLKEMPLESVTRASSVTPSTKAYNNKRNGTTCDLCKRPGHWRVDCYEFPKRTRNSTTSASESV